MEITFVGASSPHGSSHSTTSIEITNQASGNSKTLLTGVNLLRPLGAPLAALPAGLSVRNMQGLVVGTEGRHDSGLEVPGSVVIPVVPVRPTANLNPGTNFLQLIWDGNALAIGPGSPMPSSVPHIAMTAGTARTVPAWTLSDPVNLNVQITVLEQTVPGAILKLHEGALVVFTDLQDVSALGIAVDVFPLQGGGARVRAIPLAQLFAISSFAGVFV